MMMGESETEANELAAESAEMKMVLAAPTRTTRLGNDSNGSSATVEQLQAVLAAYKKLFGPLPLDLIAASTPPASSQQPLHVSLTLSDLPPELWAQIAKYLPSLSLDLLRLIKTCKFAYGLLMARFMEDFDPVVFFGKRGGAGKTRRLSREPPNPFILWRQFCTGPLGTDKFKYVKNLSVSVDPTLGGPAWRPNIDGKLLYLCTNLASLDLAAQLGANHLSEIHSPHVLTTLRLDLFGSTPDPGKLTKVPALPRLKHLAVDIAKPEMAPVLNRLVESAPVLEQVTLTFDFAPRHMDLSPFADQLSDRLVELIRTLRFKQDHAGHSTFLASASKRQHVIRQNGRPIHERNLFQPTRLEFLSDKKLSAGLLHTVHAELHGSLRELHVQLLATDLLGWQRLPESIQSFHAVQIDLTAQIHGNLDQLFRNLSKIPNFTIGEILPKPSQVMLNDTLDCKWEFELEYWEKQTGRRLWNRKKNEAVREKRRR